MDFVFLAQMVTRMAPVPEPATLPGITDHCFVTSAFTVEALLRNWPDNSSGRRDWKNFQTLPKVMPPRRTPKPKTLSMTMSFGGKVLPKLPWTAFWKKWYVGWVTPYVIGLRWDNSRIFQGARNRNWAPARPLFMPTHSQSNYKGPIRTFHNY